MMCGFACVCCEREREEGSCVIDVGGAGCTGAGEMAVEGASWAAKVKAIERWWW